MAVQPGRHQLGPDRGRILLRTFRDGLAATAGHDLTIEATRWSGVLEQKDDLSPANLEVRIDMNALVVVEGTGGVKPLTDRDRKEIAETARKRLTADRYPEAVFAAGAFTAGPEGGGEISGTLTLGATSNPLQMRVSKIGPERYYGQATVVQSDYGIKPYTAFLGALRVRDAVDVAIDVDLSGEEGGDGSPG